MQMMLGEQGIRPGPYHGQGMGLCGKHILCEGQQLPPWVVVIVPPIIKQQVEVFERLCKPETLLLVTDKGDRV